MDVKVKKAAEADYSYIKNLVPYYIYDMSEYLGWGCNKEGCYDGCDELTEYWKKENHHPYLIEVDGETAGFVMLRPFPDEEERMEIGEFFILRKFKRKGIGKSAAFYLFNSFPGLWLVRILDKNVGGLKFWENVIAEYTEEKFKRKSDHYTCPHSGTWNMQFFRFKTNDDPVY